MRTLVLLLQKDLRRAWRNPAGPLVFLAIPLVITGIIGLIFGPKSNQTNLGKIRFAIVDEDNSALTRLLPGAFNQPEARDHLEPIFLNRADALKQVQAGALSAMLLIPEGFTRAYLTSTNPVNLELVKNPAESIHPAVLEELVGVLVTGLSEIQQHFGPELIQWQPALDGQVEPQRVFELIARAGNQLQAANKVLFPPRVVFEKGSFREQLKTASAARPRFNIFAFLLPGLASMFLLFLGENATRDLHRELEQRTLQRFQTMHPNLYLFVGSKLVYCLVFLLLSSAIMLGGGGLIFQIDWRHPAAIVLLTAAYCIFVSGLVTLFPALVGDARSAQVLGSTVAMVLGLAGGSLFPARQLPAFLREHICPLLPNYWYTEAMRTVAFEPHGAWVGVCLRTALLGMTMLVVAAALLQRSLEKGRAE